MAAKSDRSIMSENKTKKKSSKPNDNSGDIASSDLNHLPRRGENLNNIIVRELKVRARHYSINGVKALHLESL